MMNIVNAANAVLLCADTLLLIFSSDADRVTLHQELVPCCRTTRPLLRSLRQTDRPGASDRYRAYDYQSTA